MVEFKGAVEKAVNDRAEELVSLSHGIHSDPELAFEEVRASSRVAEQLTAAGFDVDMGVCNLPTAFRATYGSGALHIGICAEYDALPGIGHACGHNIIAAAAVGAASALTAVADELDLTVEVLGTPGEEGGGGKILMLQRGGFSGLHAAMMVHPYVHELVAFPCLAVAHVELQYTGKAAHASAFPELGINAADALTVAQTSIGLLRQHLPPSARVHGIVTKGGDAANIVPESTSAVYYVRDESLAALEDVFGRVEACWQAGALATGASLHVREAMPRYSEFTHDVELAALYRANAEALGRVFTEITPAVARAAGSTDMANVSLEMPTIHPMLDIGAAPAVNHQAEFAAACITGTADAALVQGAISMAQTCVDAAQGSLRERLVQQ